LAIYEARERIQAWREGWITYLPRSAAYLAASLAGLFVLLTPVAVRYVVAFIAAIGELIGSNFTYLAWPLFYAAHLFSVGYVSIIWPFLIGSVPFGAAMGFLRRRYGFRYREIPWRPYEQRIRLPLPLHSISLYAAGPLVLYLMAVYVDRRVYVRLLSGNFMLWATSGIIAKLLWELYTDLILILGARAGLWPAPHRRLDAEYQIRRTLDEYAELSTMRVHDIYVDVEGHAVITATLTSAQERRLKELLKHHLADIVSLKIIAR
jgi:hypothetical protein